MSKAIVMFAVIAGIVYGVVSVTAYRIAYPCKTDFALGVVKALLWQRIDRCDQ